MSSVAARNAILLIEMFLEDEAFAKETQQVRARFQEAVNTGLNLDISDAALVDRGLSVGQLLRAQVEEIAERGEGEQDDTLIAGQRIDAPALEEMAREAQSVGARIGLKAPWAGYAILLPEVVYYYFGALWNNENPQATEVRVNPHVFVQAQYSPLWDRRIDVERYISTQAKDQLDAIDRQWARAGVGKPRKKPAAEQHVTWLFLRLRDPKTATWDKIATDSDTEIRTVRDAVESLARDLQVELPRIPRGRPKKLRN